jgi:hypothetical protein
LYAPVGWGGLRPRVAEAVDCPHRTSRTSRTGHQHRPQRRRQRRAASPVPQPVHDGPHGQRRIAIGIRAPNLQQWPSPRFPPSRLVRHLPSDRRRSAHCRCRGQVSHNPKHSQPRVRRPEAANPTKATHPKVVAQRSEHVGRRPSGRLWRGGRRHRVHSPHREPIVQVIGRQSHRAPDGDPRHYERHCPEQITLYPLVK